MATRMATDKPTIMAMDMAMETMIKIKVTEINKPYYE
jgi:hypothetical protein